MMRLEITSPGFDFRKDKESFKEIGSMVPGVTSVCCSKVVAPLALKAPTVVSNSPRSFVLVLLCMKIPSRPLPLRTMPSPSGKERMLGRRRRPRHILVLTQGDRQSVN
jgi:hypothetical protein